MHTPFFPLWRPRLAALGRRVEHLRQQSLAPLEQLLGPWLPPGLLSQNDQGPNSRDRIYSVRRTLFGLHGQTRVDEGTGAYCQARKRLPLDKLQRLRVALAAAAEKTAQLWHGLRVILIDGTTTSLPDTPKSQRAYPQSSG